MILDTSYLIDLFEGREAAFQRGLERTDAGTVQRIPSPVVMELTYGAEFGDDDERRNVRYALGIPDRPPGRDHRPARWPVARPG